jgi:predicted TIM-barrel fold metal-dependent hydrolase
MKDPLGVELRHRIGVERIMWGSDFAHAAGDWPNSLEVLDEILAGVPQSERDAVLANNAVAFFRLEVN